MKNQTLFPPQCGRNLSNYAPKKEMLVQFFNSLLGSDYLFYCFFTMFC